MKPAACKTKIFLDSGNPQDTTQAIEVLGFLDGQTTNPSLIAQHPQLQELKNAGKRVSREELVLLYRDIVRDISRLIPAGSVSLEVYADSQSTPEELFEQGQQMFSWIPNAHIKYPITAAGVQAASQSVKAGMRVNMTLCFSQEQAAAVYSATKGAKPGDVFLSPFIGRLDDIGVRGLDLIENILRMYRGGDRHVQVLAASVRTLEHLRAVISGGCDIVTAPLKVLRDWAAAGFPCDAQVSGTSFLNGMPYETCNIEADWKTMNISHELTDKGLERFAHDWNALIMP